MKRPLIAFLFPFVLIVILSESVIAEDFPFREIKWGMSKDQVKASEPLAVKTEREDALLYETTVANKDVFLIYYFFDNQLYRAAYALNEKHTNDNLYLTDYEDFEKLLIKKYGPQINESTRWLNDLYKDDRSDWGLAISVGHLERLSRWETPNTIITLGIKGDNFDILCIISYTSKSLKPLAEKAKEEEQLEAF